MTDHDDTADALIPGANPGRIHVSFYICNFVVEFKVLPFCEALLHVSREICSNLFQSV